MPPTNEVTTITGVLFEEDAEIIRKRPGKGMAGDGGNIEGDGFPDNAEVPPEYKMQIVWPNVVVFFLLHSAALYGAYLSFTASMFRTNLFALLVAAFSTIGVTAGAHRLWTHRSYKATFGLRLFLMLWDCVALQNSLHEWTRDHRVHHKFSETNADPHNAKRGFFFSHVGWLMVKKHPDVKNKGKTIDLSDLEADPIVMFQKKYYVPLVVLFCFYLPAAIPVYLWGETWVNAFFVASIFRYVYVLNGTWLVNSAAHIWGNKPYDKEISPADNIAVAYLGFGEGWHNYHHVFPWDYKTSELPLYRFNITCAFIDLMAKWGLAYDLKTIDPSTITKRATRTGDGTHPQRPFLWGWGDFDKSNMDKETAKTLNQPWLAEAFCFLFEYPTSVSILMAPVIRNVYNSLFQSM